MVRSFYTTYYQVVVLCTIKGLEIYTVMLPTTNMQTIYIHVSYNVLIFIYALMYVVIFGTIIYIIYKLRWTKYWLFRNCLQCLYSNFCPVCLSSFSIKAFFSSSGSALNMKIDLSLMSSLTMRNRMKLSDLIEEAKL